MAEDAVQEGPSTAQRALQETMANVDLVLLRNGHYNYEIDVAAREDVDGRSTLYLCIERSRAEDGADASQALPQFQIGLHPEACRKVNLHGMENERAPEFLAMS